MSKILIFILSAIMGIGTSDAAVRDGNAAVRAKGDSTQPTQQRVSTTSKSDRSSARTTALVPRSTSSSGRSTTARTATTTKTNNRGTTARSAGTPVSNRTAIARAAAEAVVAPQTRTGAEYERCKNAYFTCMDQFCTLKNDDYRRCSCNDRVNELSEIRDVITQAGEQLTVFTENLDVVGMTAAQATAMITASDGENAMTADTSASKALLQAIMNSIRGEDATVGGKFTDLNSINISFDTANAFGVSDSGQLIASYNGKNLYNAVYPQCRDAVRADCNDASLQRAITAYLMAIEQDCNTVQTAIQEKQKKMKSAIREGNAMLDLARIENRQKHNSYDVTTCLANVEQAILSEQVCGTGYHKCLDNGEFIDVSTGAPIAGVANFYKLEQMLTFADGIEPSKQKLSKINKNRQFVTNFENKTKKFAEPVLDKCVEKADLVWSEYLDKALLDIYYAQRAKVSEIKQSCFDFVSSCYVNGDKALTDAMKNLLADSAISVTPSKIILNNQMCNDYVQSCNNMFDGNIIAQYIDEREQADTLASCRAVVKQCFDKFGGTGYENFYYPYSGLFEPETESAPEWFTLYEIVDEEIVDKKYATSDDFFKREGIRGLVRYKSACARQLADIDACNSVELIEKAFGGFDLMYVIEFGNTSNDDQTSTVADEEPESVPSPSKPQKAPATRGDGYSTPEDTKEYVYTGNPEDKKKFGLQNSYTEKNEETTLLAHRRLRPTGVATEIYNQVVDILSTQCANLQGRFIEPHQIKVSQYNPENYCEKTLDTNSNNDEANDIAAKTMEAYLIGNGEDMCPRDYKLAVDIQSWGACLCWENGARRSKWGKSPKCVAALPVETEANDSICTKDDKGKTSTQGLEPTYWCTQTTLSSNHAVCPLGVTSTKTCDEKIENKVPSGTNK